MPRYQIDCDERYPDYFLRDENPGDKRQSFTIELSDEEHEDYKRACQLYNDWQDKLERLEKEQSKRFEREQWEAIEARAKR